MFTDQNVVVLVIQKYDGRDEYENANTEKFTVGGGTSLAYLRNIYHQI